MVREPKEKQQLGRATRAAGDLLTQQRDADRATVEELSAEFDWQVIAGRVRARYEGILGRTAEADR